MRRILLPLLLLGASATRAEVRLVPSSVSPSVRIVESSQGTWSPAGRIDALVLNPQGDALGDGMPSSARAGAKVLVAWSAGSGDSINLALGGTSWQMLPPIGTAGRVQH